MAHVGSLGARDQDFSALQQEFAYACTAGSACVGGACAGGDVDVWGFDGFGAGSGAFGEATAWKILIKCSFFFKDGEIVEVDAQRGLVRRV